MNYGTLDGEELADNNHKESVSSRTPLLNSSNAAQDVLEDVHINIPHTKDNQMIVPNEYIKTLLSFIFLMFGFLVTTFSLALTHERVPHYKPLPDIILDHSTYLQWGLKVSEIIIVLSILLAFATVLLHTQRMVIVRRVFLILGLLYMYRGLTMFVTVLPKSDQNYQCAPQLNHTITILELVSRVATMFAGGGLSLNGRQVYCGDFIFSGHTMILMVAFFVVREYSPRTKMFLVFHLLSFLLSLTGVIMLLLSRGHYSIDCLVAYWVTSRVWWTYHTLASTTDLRMSGDHNHLANIWWWYLFRYAEINVPTKLPRRYSIPLPARVVEVIKKYLLEVLKERFGTRHQRLEATSEA